MDAPKSGSCEPSIVRVRVCRCRRSCGSCDCRRLASMPGDGCSTPVRLTISRPARTRHPIESLRPEIQAIKDMVTSVEYRHVPTGTLAVLAQRLGKVWASPSTWYHLVRKYGWRRPRLRVHPAKPKVGLRTTRANEIWHIDTTVIRLLDGTPRLRARGDRQLLAANLGVAGR